MCTNLKQEITVNSLSGGVNNLSGDVIVDILSRLSPKSLYRFRCVSKSWYAFICPHFIRVDNRHQKIFHLFEAESSYSVLDFYKATYDNIDNVAMLTVESPKEGVVPIPSLPSNAFILTSCDGWLLLSLEGSNKLFLFNSFTMEFKEFLSYQKEVIDSSGDHFGILYDCSVNDYIVVNVKKESYKLLLRIYSFKTKSWTKRRNLPYWDFSIIDHGVSVNGVLHWISNHSTRISILRFDLKDGFMCVPKPARNNWYSSALYGQISLASLRGNLCAFMNNLTSHVFTLMEMKQYGVVESWTKVCTINIHPYSLVPLTFTKKGDLVLMSKKELIIYNVEYNLSKTFKRFEGEVFNRHVVSYADCSIDFTCDCWCNRKEENRVLVIMKGIYSAFSGVQQVLKNIMRENLWPPKDIED